MINRINNVMKTALKFQGSYPAKIRTKDYIFEIGLCSGYPAILIPSVKITLKTIPNGVSIEDMANLAMTLVGVLMGSSLSDYCDFQMSIEFNEVDQTIELEFLDYNIKKG